MPFARLLLTDAERAALEARSRSASSRPAEIRRARLLLLLDSAVPYREIQQLLGCNQHFISSWKKRFLAERLAGLYSRHAGRPPRVKSQQFAHQAIVAIEANSVLGKPAKSLRGLAREIGTHHMAVARARAQATAAGIAPVRAMTGWVPAWTSGGELLGVYVNPPQHAVVFGIVAGNGLERVDPVTLLSLGQAPPVTGALLPPAASTAAPSTAELARILNAARPGAAAPNRHTAAELVAFLEAIISQAAALRLELIADNPTTTRGLRVQRFLTDNPGTAAVVLPTVTAWLACVEARMTYIDRAGAVGGRVVDAAELLPALREACRAHRRVKWVQQRPR